MEKSIKRPGFKIGQVSFEALKDKYGEQEAQKIWDNLQQSRQLMETTNEGKFTSEKGLPLFKVTE
jgi:hypothetical protein